MEVRQMTEAECAAALNESRERVAVLEKELRELHAQLDETEKDLRVLKKLREAGQRVFDESLDGTE